LKHRFARGRRSIEPLLVQEQTDTLVMKSLENAEQVGKRSTKLIDRPRRDHVELFSRSPQSGSPSSQNARIFDAEVAESGNVGRLLARTVAPSGFTLKLLNLATWNLGVLKAVRGSMSYLPDGPRSISL
jgi:hypothetical protein